MKLPGANGKVYTEWKWLIGPLPLPICTAVLIPASMYRLASLTALTIGMPRERLHAIAEASEHPVPWVLLDRRYSLSIKVTPLSPTSTFNTTSRSTSLLTT